MTKTALSPEGRSLPGAGPAPAGGVIEYMEALKASDAGRISGAGTPRLLFFSGGTALDGASRVLAAGGFDCVHLVTPFDSGGSSAALRRAFAMPAVGDARARIMALADTRWPGSREVYALFAHRLPATASRESLEEEMRSLAQGGHPLVSAIPDPLRGVVRELFSRFLRHMPADFPLAGASAGNMAISAACLRNGRRLGPALELFSAMLHVRGLTRPIVEDAAHLAVRLASGEVIVGQHKFTGKKCARISSPITDIWLASAENSPKAADIAITPSTDALIRGAGCLCYPVGSFYSSVVANLLPRGVGRAVAGNAGLKVFVPNPAFDPELVGHSLAMQVEALLRPLLADAPGTTPRDVLSHLLVDAERGRYPGGIPRHMLERLGIRLVSLPLLTGDSAPLADARLLAGALLRVAGEKA